MRSEQLTVDGITTRWEEAGEGVAAVLVHGIPASPSLWRHVVPLVEGARCLALEMVGYGASIPLGRDRDISLGRQADHLVAWLDALELGRVVLVGHDLGGGVAHIAAVRHPERCAGLVLTNSVGYDSWPIPMVKALRAGDAVVSRLPAAALAPGIALLMARGHDDLRVARDSFPVHWRHYRRHGGGAALARQVASLDVDDTLAVADQVRGLDVPARVVWGAADPFQKVRYGQRFADDLRTDLRRIRGGRHFVPEDHPDEIAAAIIEVAKEADLSG
ncbi:MAG: alpha/beta fold hydrolase [Nitriliruptorales bacterium]